jgi:hypothetical protein
MLAAAIVLFSLVALMAAALIHYALPTRRERLAAAALTGLLADHKDHGDECAVGETCPRAVARLAVEHADELIRRLDSTESPDAPSPGDDAVMT